MIKKSAPMILSIKMLFILPLFLVSWALPQKDRTFTFPEIPSVLQTPEARLDFLVQHYWDHFDFQDTAYMHLPDVTEQAFVNYIDLLTRVTDKKSAQCVTTMLQSAAKEPKMFHYFVEMYRNYWVDPNSPLRNEEAFEPVAKYLLRSPLADDAARIQAQFDLEQINLNRRGSIAHDFVYTVASGKQLRMHDLRTDYTLIIFYDPDCEECDAELKYMRSVPLFMDKQALTRLSMLAFYPDGQKEIWEQRQGKIPSTWINSYDKNQTVLNEGLYGLKAMPSFYLLDREKRVLMKDARIEEVVQYLAEKLQ